jgi:hypothetical protein
MLAPIAAEFDTAAEEEEEQKKKKRLGSETHLNEKATLHYLQLEVSEAASALALPVKMSQEGW